MNKFFAPNINGWGRLARAIWGLGLIVAGAFFSGGHGWVAFVLILFGVFALYEAIRGWCIMRACGIKTRM
jgi:hypothetical protein